MHTSVRLLDEDRLDHPLIARRVKRHAHQDPSDGDPRLVGRAADGELLVRLALAEERQIALPPVLGPVEQRRVPRLRECARQALRRRLGGGIARREEAEGDLAAEASARRVKVALVQRGQHVANHLARLERRRRDGRLELRALLGGRRWVDGVGGARVWAGGYSRAEGGDARGRERRWCDDERSGATGQQQIKHLHRVARAPMGVVVGTVRGTQAPTDRRPPIQRIDRS